MAHLVETMAFVGQTPWHGLGNQLTPNQPIEVWAQQAGMDWRIESSDVSYMAQNEKGQSIIMPLKNNGFCIDLIPMHRYLWLANVFRRYNRVLS
jgi:hypothetical protein